MEAAGRRLCERRKCKIVLFGVEGQVRRTFDIARLESSIPILSDRGEAIAALRGLRADSG